MTITTEATIEVGRTDDGGTNFTTGTLIIKRRGDGGIEFTASNGEKWVIHSNRKVRDIFDQIAALV